MSLFKQAITKSPNLIVPAESTHSRAVSEPQSGGGTDSHVYAQSITSTEGQNRHTVSCITPIPPSTSPLPHTATEPHVYTEPSTSNKGQNGPTITHTAPSPPSSSPPPHTATETQEFVYAQPHVTRTSQSVEPVSNPEYFYTQPHIEVSVISLNVLFHFLSFRSCRATMSLQSTFLLR